LSIALAVRTVRPTLPNLLTVFLVVHAFVGFVQSVVALALIEGW